jgi:hypothetical protein
MAIKRAIRWIVEATISSAGLGTLYTERVREKELVCVQRLSCEINKAVSGGNTRIRIYIDRDGVRFPIYEDVTAAADTLFSIMDAFWLIPGERIALEVDQAQASTIARLWAIGYFQDVADGIG